jgi:hypothetical protein
VNKTAVSKLKEIIGKINENRLSVVLGIRKNIEM